MLPPNGSPAPQMPDGGVNGNRRTIAAMLLAAALLAYGAANAWPFFADDAYISLRYASRLLHGHGLTWNDGERVEGYSNLLWTLLCAALGALGCDLTVAARALGVACTLGTCALLARRFGRTWPSAWSAAAFAAAAPTPIWAIGGLEMPLVWLCATGGLLACERAFAAERPIPHLLRAGAWFAAACLTRPDAPLFVALAGLVTLLTYFPHGLRQALLRTGAVFAAAALAMLAQLAFRVAYYGDFLPNTARVKLGHGGALWSGGLVYLRVAIPALAPIVGSAVLALVVLLRHATAPRNTGAPTHRPQTAYVALLALLLCSWPIYVARVGGDIFPGWRLLSPMLVPAALLTGLVCESLALRQGRSRWLALGIALTAILGGRIGAHFDPETARAAEERFEHDYEALGRVLGASFAREQPLFAVQAAGALCYASELPALDMFGLNDRAIALDPSPVADPTALGAFGAAHRRGRPEYLAQRAPDLISFDEQLVPQDAAGQAWVDSAEFVRDYRCVLFRAADVRQHGAARGSELVLPLWVQTTGRIGIQSSADGLRVPAYLLGALPHTPGRRYAPPTAPAELAAWVQANPDVFAWYQRPLVAAPGPASMQLEVRAPGQFELGPIAGATRTWSAALLPNHEHCRVQLVPSGEQLALQLIVAPSAKLPLRIDAVVLAPSR